MKCDEMVPCGHCKARGFDCLYNRPSNTFASGSATDRMPAMFPQNSAEAASNQVSADRHLHELSLLHRWFTATFDTIPTRYPDDTSIWQTEMPEIALQYPFLLNAMFAITTFELCGPPDSAASDYVKAALEYKTLAVQQIPPLTGTTPSDANAALLYLSPLLLLLAIVSVQFQPPGVPLRSILQQLTAHLDALKKLHDHLKAYSFSLNGHPLQQTSIPPSDLPSEPLDVSTAATFRQLDELNKSRPAPPPSAPFEVRFQATLHQSSCKKAIFWLEEAFTNLPPPAPDHEDMGPFHDHCLGWLTLIDGEYIGALREGDQVATLLFLAWALLVQTRGYRFWGARRFGTRMFAAISSTFGDSTSAGVHEILEWASQHLYTG